MPILGVIDSAKTGNLIPPSAFDALATTTLATSTATISFTSIPATYSHLHFRIWGYNNSGSDRSLLTRFNNDSGTNYSNHFMIGGGTNPAIGGGTTSQDGSYIFDTNTKQRGFNGDPAKASIMIIDILDYANISKFKTIRNLGGWGGNETGWVGLGSSLWRSTTAINRVDFSLPFSTNFQPGTVISMYGIRG